MMHQLDLQLPLNALHVQLDYIVLMEPRDLIIVNQDIFVVVEQQYLFQLELTEQIQIIYAH